jgi:hypothetical protein
MDKKSAYNKIMNEIFQRYRERSIFSSFTLGSISTIFEIGNEVFYKYYAQKIEKINNRPKNKAPDLYDDEPFSFERTFKIFNVLQSQHAEITPRLIKEIFSLNQFFAWKSYHKRYSVYIQESYESNKDDPYFNYLAAIVFFDNKNWDKALHCINIAGAEFTSSAVISRIKGLIFLQWGELDAAKTYFYQALFLLEMRQDTPINQTGNNDAYPNFSFEMSVSAKAVRRDLKNIKTIEKSFNNDILALLNE